LRQMSLSRSGLQALSPEKRGWEAESTLRPR
jgi:hypothetical protein